MAHFFYQAINQVTTSLKFYHKQISQNTGHPISHITLIVTDLKKSTQLFQKLFRAKEVYSSEEVYHSLSKEKFFLIHGVWFALMEREALPKKLTTI